MGKKYLFVCVQNRDRSPYAAHWFAHYCAEHGIDVETKSAGFYPDAHDVAQQKATKLDATLVNWADIICVTSDITQSFLTEQYPTNTKRVVNLDIPDRFRHKEQATDHEYTCANVRSAIDTFAKTGYGPQVMNALLETKIDEILRD
jgi:predicted protein tyrosine phosphatase